MYHNLKKAIRTHLAAIASFMEILASAIIVLVIIFSTFYLLTNAVGMMQNDFTYEDFNDFLGHALMIIIGIEFVKMLCKHTPGSAIEVLVYAIARQLIVHETTPLDNLFTILGIAVLFIIRKFAFIKSFDEPPKSTFNGSHKIGRVNLLSSVMIPGPHDQTIGNVIRAKLAVEGDELTEGASVAFPGVVLRVLSVKNGLVERVEVIPQQ